MRILFLPLANVLGHLARSLALAEEFNAQGDDVSVAMGGCYSRIMKVLSPTIRVLNTTQMYSSVVRSFGPIKHYPETTVNDLENLENCALKDEVEIQRRTRRMKLMVKQDAEIVNHIQPDAIVTDYRFTTPFLSEQFRRRVFHISNILGYPSFCSRVTGKYPPPLNSGHILVPGIKDIEYSGCAPDRALRGRETMCGPFYWRGWGRIQSDAPSPPPSHVFLSFGSTGNYNRVVPWLLQTIPKRLSVSAIASSLSASGRRNAFFSSLGELRIYLDQADVVFCHGGHGTVMECIRQQTPMAIFPNNLEQLEIGRRIQELQLGVLVDRPLDQLSSTDLDGIYQDLNTNKRIHNNLCKYAALLRIHDSEKIAVSAVRDIVAD
ncbi:N/A [soil metagenome]